MAYQKSHCSATLGSLKAAKIDELFMNTLYTINAAKCKRAQIINIRQRPTTPEKFENAALLLGLDLSSSELKNALRIPNPTWGLG